MASADGASASAIKFGIYDFGGLWTDHAHARSRVTRSAVQMSQ